MNSLARRPKKRAASQVERELDEELNSHVEHRTTVHRRQELSASDATRRARLDSGRLEQVKAVCRDARGRRWLEDLARDLRFATRILSKARWFTLAAVLTLAIGLGTITAVFSVIESALLRGFSYPDPERLVLLQHIGERQQVAIPVVSGPNFRDWESQAESFEALAAVHFSPMRPFVAGTSIPEQVDVSRASAGAFPVMGIEVAHGQDFRTADRRDNVAIITDGFARRHFGGAQAALGQSIVIRGTTLTVIGVLRRDWSLMADILVPLGFDEPFIDDRAAQRLQVLGRLKPGVTVEQAQAEMTLITDQLEQAYPGANRGLAVSVEPLLNQAAPYYAPRLWVTFGAAGFVLLIACLNVATLQLVRFDERRQELRVRRAFGAANRHLVRQLLTESMILAIAGASVGLLVAFGTLRAIIALAPAVLILNNPPTFNLSVFGFLGAAIGVTMLLAGFLPAMRFVRAAGTGLVAGRSLTGGVSRRRIRRGLVSVQVALSVVLLSGAGLLLQDLSARQAASWGFDARDKLTVRVSLPKPRYQSMPARLDYLGAVRDQLLRLPAVTDVTAVNYVPAGGYVFNTRLWVEGRNESPFQEAPGVQFRTVDADYFRVMDIPVLGGRSFDNRDIAGASPVLMVNDTLRRRLFGEELGLGRLVHLEIWNPTGTRAGDPLDPSGTLVGVVGDVRDRGPDPEPRVYLPYSQHTDSSITFVVVRSRSNVASVQDIHTVLASVDSLVEPETTEMLEQVTGRQLVDPRFFTSLLTGFALVALMLAAVGLHGVLAQGVTQRGKEFSVRMALGAQMRDIRWLVGKEAGWMSIAGLLVGLGAVISLRGLLQNFVVSEDLSLRSVFLLGPLTFFVVVAIAVLAPVRRAARANPAVALRAE